MNTVKGNLYGESTTLSARAISINGCPGERINQSNPSSGNSLIQNRRLLEPKGILGHFTPQNCQYFQPTGWNAPNPALLTDEENWNYSRPIKKMNTASRTPVIQTDKEHSTSREFEDPENIHRTIENLSEENRKEEEKSSDRRKKRCNFMHSAFFQKQWFTKKQKAVSQITCKCDECDRHNFSPLVPTVWVWAPCRPVEHEILLFNVPRNLRLMVIHPRD